MSVMNDSTGTIHSVVENITRTLLYEGYALFPYYRSAVKNQKPVPFGVVYPESYHTYNEHAHATMQTQCIITGSDDFSVNITIRFLHLKRIALFTKGENDNDFIPAHNVLANGQFYEAGWQTIERKITTGFLPAAQLKTKQTIPVEFGSIQDDRIIYDEEGNAVAKQTERVSPINGSITIEAIALENIEHTFKITVTITNTTPVANAEAITRDEATAQSFLSTHTILQAANASFISHQSPADHWKEVIALCDNKNTWPILIDEGNTILLSSPIILHDYPAINPQSHGNLFDSTEIEEALLLHVNLLSDEEKFRIGQSDEKLLAMLQKVSEVTPEELINFHSMLKGT